MSKTQKIKLFNYQVIIEDSPLSISSVELLLKDGFNKAPSETEMQQITAYADNSNPRFIHFVFSVGNVYPLPPKLISVQNGKQKKNKRKRTEYEPKYSYGLMDCQTAEVWLQYKDRAIFKEALEEKNPNKSIEIKQILDEKQFLEKINSLHEIKLGVKPDLLASGILSQSLQDDIYQFGASYAEVIFKYKKEHQLFNIKPFTESLIGKKHDFKKLVIAGRDTENFELVFNTNIVSSKMSLIVAVDENGLVKEKDFFKQAHAQILGISHEI